MWLFFFSFYISPIPWPNVADEHRAGWLYFFPLYNPLSAQDSNSECQVFRLGTTGLGLEQLGLGLRPGGFDYNITLADSKNKPLSSLHVCDWDEFRAKVL